MSGSIKIIGKSKGGLFMYQSRDWNLLCDKETQLKKADCVIKRLHADVNTAHQFLYIVNDTLQRCEGVGAPFAGKGHDVSLLFRAYDDVQFDIGYADEGFYLLDSDFIYERYCHFWRKNFKQNHNEIFGREREKSDYYALLFQLGIIESYGKLKKPLCKIRFNSSSADKPDSYKKCFCIFTKFVDFDMQNMKVY